MNTLSQFLREATIEGQEHTISFAQKVLGENEGKDIQITLRKKSAEPIRAESDARNHDFFDEKVFAAYLKKYGTKDTLVLADINELTIESVLNEKTEKGFEMLTMKPKLHPLFLPFNELPKSHSCRSFANFIMQNRRSIIKPVGRELAIIMSQLKVSKAISIYEGSGKHAINGVMCEMDIAGQIKKEPIDIPEEIILEVPMFVGRPKVRFTLDLIVDCPREEVVITLSSPDIDEIKISEFQDMLSKLKKATKDGVIVGLGSVNHKGWDYIKSIEQ